MQVKQEDKANNVRIEKESVIFLTFNYSFKISIMMVQKTQIKIIEILIN